VQLGAPSEDLYPVSSGLVLGDKVVLNGNFLIDSQAHLSSGVSGLYGGSKEFATMRKGRVLAKSRLQKIRVQTQRRLSFMRTPIHSKAAKIIHSTQT